MTENINNNNTKKNETMKTVKTVIRFVVGGLVELFAGAVTSCVVGRVDSNKAAKVGAKVGGYLVGLTIADQVSNYICNEIDETMNDLDELKNALEEASE